MSTSFPDVQGSQFSQIDAEGEDEQVSVDEFPPLLPECCTKNQECIGESEFSGYEGQIHK